MKKYFRISCLLLVTISNYWVWQIFSNNLILGVGLVITEFLLFSLIGNRQATKAKTSLKLGFVFVLLFIGAFFLRDRFDRTLTSLSPTEVSINNQRYVYLAESFGKYPLVKYIPHYYSTYSVYTRKYLTNVFYTLDPNLYFFRSHPREKAGIDETNKYPAVALPFFIAGVLIITIQYQKYKFTAIYAFVAALLSGLIDPGFKLGPVLMFPFVNIVIYLGLTESIRKAKDYLKI